MMLVIDESRQAAFAQLSGDHNPVHVEAEFARRSQFGSKVVHGVHLVLAALDSLNLATPTRITRLDVQFRAAVLVGESVTFDVAESTDAGRQITVRVDTLPRAVISVHTSSIDTVGSVSDPPTWPTLVASSSDFDELEAVSGRDTLAFDRTSFARLFPSLVGWLAAVDAATLLGTTRVVGMRCPGRWALLRRLEWELTGEATDPTELEYAVAAVRRRFAMLTVALAAGDRRVRAETIVRDPPPEQAGMTEVRSRVQPSEFHDVRALVVGGSRGLGELTAKVFAAGSAPVLLSYRSGADDAAAVAAQIGEESSIVQLDVEDINDEAETLIREFAPTHVSFFATPPIAKRPPNSWDAETYERFHRVYVTGLSRLLSLADDAAALKSVLYPSSIFVENHQVGFAEYIAAKLKGEEFCQQWQQDHPDQRIIVERFPPLVTDQTAARLGSDAATNLDALLPVLRRLQ